jgi:hypothetical protein
MVTFNFAPRLLLAALLVAFPGQVLTTQENTHPDAASKQTPALATAGSAEQKSPELKLDSAIASYCEGKALGREHSSALADVCEFALSMSRKLPDVICDREMRRYWWTPRGLLSHVDEDHEDTVTEKVAYWNRQEYYSDTRINGQPVDAAAAEKSGTWSDGEFASILPAIFHPLSSADIQFKREGVLRSTEALVFEFRVESRNNRSYYLQSVDPKAGNRSWFPDYHGQLWLDKTTFRLLRLERETAYMPKEPITSMKTKIDYVSVPLGDGTDFVLPTNSDVYICSLSGSTNVDKCSHNIIKFTNWHKFRAKTQILTNSAH